MHDHCKYLHIMLFILRKEILYKVIVIKRQSIPIIYVVLKN